jgi:hypothetical protein
VDEQLHTAIHAKVKTKQNAVIKDQDLQKITR